MGFKIKSPYKIDPTPIHEVPFSDPNLMGKANDNGHIIMNKDQARDPEMREKIKIHEKQHLNDMLVEKNPDGSPKLEYDEDSVKWKGTEYNRDEFDEGDKKLPWEEGPYMKDNKDIDFTGKLKTSPLGLIGNKQGKYDEDEVSMGESFGPASFMKGPRGNSSPFKNLQEKGLLNDDVDFSHLEDKMWDNMKSGANSYREPDVVEENYQDDEALRKFGKNVGNTAGQFGSALNQIKDISEKPGSQELSTDDIDNYVTNVDVGEKIWTTGENEKGKFRKWEQTTTKNTRGDKDRPSAEETYPNVDHKKYPTLDSYKDYIKNYWEEKETKSGIIYDGDGDGEENKKPTVNKVSDRQIGTVLNEEGISKGDKSQDVSGATDRTFYRNPRSKYVPPTYETYNYSNTNRNTDKQERTAVLGNKGQDDLTNVGVSKEDAYGLKDGTIADDYKDSVFNKGLKDE